MNRMNNEKLKMKGNSIYHTLQSGLIVLSLFTLLLSFPSCNPEAPWETKNVDINMEIKTVSAGYVECEFSTSKEAYYLISIEKASPNYSPMEHQKQFMMLALDSANLKYLEWRNELLNEGEFNIAPFSSHALQYGQINHFFTGLEPGTTYWVYAFVVDPELLEPAGKLHLVTITTKDSSALDIHFEYRVWGYWDYIYPVDSKGNIYGRFPYLATTRDSTEIAKEGKSPELFFAEYFLFIMENNFTENIRYGVYAVENNASESYLEFQPGHTYYTAIVGFDGYIGNNVIYKFTWTGEDFKAYFKDEDSIVSDGEDD